MIKNRKIVLSIIVLFILALVFFVYKKNNKYNINAKIREYDLTKEKDQYLNYLKNFIKPVKLQNFINNGYINLSLYTNEASGNDVMAELYFEGYENLMTHLFEVLSVKSVLSPSISSRTPKDSQLLNLKP